MKTPERMCPNCNATLAPESLRPGSGNVTCPTCGAPLPGDFHAHTDSRMVTVYVPGDEGERMAVVSLLEGSGIPCYSKNANVQTLFGAGAIGMGYNVAAGKVHIQVIQEDETRAKEVLAAYQAGDSGAALEYEIPERCPACNSLTHQNRQCPDCGLVFVPDGS